MLLLYLALSFYRVRILRAMCLVWQSTLVAIILEKELPFCLVWGLIEKNMTRSLMFSNMWKRRRVELRFFAHFRHHLPGYTYFTIVQVQFLVKIKLLEAIATA